MTSTPWPADITLVGSEACARCGRATGLLIVRLSMLRGATDDEDVPECERCGETVSTVPVWWSAAMLPEAARGLVAFDRERRRLKLAPLSEGTWQ